MKLYLNDPKDYLTLSTEDEEVTIQTNMGIIARPDADNVKFISLSLPIGRTYLAQNLSGGGDFSIVVLPEGLTPATFGWDSVLAVKLSVLTQEIEEKTK